MTSAGANQRTGGAATDTMFRILYFGVSLFGVAFSVLGTSQNIDERIHLAPLWSIPSFALLFLIPGLIVIGSRWMPIRVLRAISATMVTVYCLALATWPLALTDTHVFDGTRPWIFGHFAIAVALAGILLSERLAWVFIVVLSTASGVLRVIAEGAAATQFAVQDALFNATIGTILVAIIQVTLRAGRARDAAADATARSLAATAALGARNVQRARVAAIIHDDIISSLIAAARFDDSAETLIRGYARNALTRLDTLKKAPGQPDEVLSSAELAATLRSVAPTFARNVVFTVDGPVIAVPTRVSEALIEAALEALRNSERHSRAQARRVELVTADEGLVVAVTDDGIGFDVRHVSAERFGIAVSIRERMAAVGGDSDVVTRPGAGTRVILRWVKA